jgi:hypothetical protein
MSDMLQQLRCFTAPEGRPAGRGYRPIKPEAGCAYVRRAQRRWAPTTLLWEELLHLATMVFGGVLRFAC